MKILSVDDNAENRYLIEAVGRAHGFEVVSARNGLEALEKLDSHPVDLIVSDVLMPEMDGFQLCHELKSRERTRKIPFIFYTATYTSRQDTELGLSLGASRYVLKPVDPDEFMTIIGEVLSEAQQRELAVPEVELKGATDYLEAYNARLIHKLTHKIEQLEATRNELQELLAARDREIAQRKSLEQQLTQAQKMEAIGQLAGGVAHDFNNLLTVISGYSGFLLRSLPEIDPAVQEVKEIVQAADRAAALTRQLLAFSRKQILKPENVDINVVIRDSERMLRRLIGEDVEIRMAFTAEELRTLVDTGQLTQVIMNLAVNARDAMPDGGVLTIETTAADFGPDGLYVPNATIPAGAYVQLMISDTGVGMDQETMARIFEPFFTTKGPGAGTGLGLSTVYGIVQQSNGHISVTSQPGHGTDFRIYLPRIFTRAETPSAQPAKAPLRGHETLLLVEDEPSVRKLTREILRRAGYKVIDAANGGEALLACEQSPAEIALMITDLVMPGISGAELAKRLASLRPNMKVLYMSGYSSHAVLTSSALEGHDFIHKPFTPNTLAEKVRSMLHQD